MELLRTQAGSGWRVLPLETDTPARLLEGGLALLETLADDPVPTLRWYRSTSTAIVLGRGQPAEALITARTAVPVLQRRSGGGAVLMTPDLLSLDVALPTGHALLDGDLSAVFVRVGRAWARALADLGLADLDVHLGPAPPRRGSTRAQLLAAVCYATVGRGEVTVGGRKLVGLAQRRRRPGALVQCGVLRRWRPGPILAALGADPDDTEIAGAAVGLDELRVSAPGDEDIMRAVGAALAEARSEHD